jgi:2-polyprenyl-6-methoxyphenol hydroxylase-like FAD-dependent oxidoreductase
MTCELHADFVDTDCCIVGGGPAGAVLALLLARQGINVILLEAHNDFDRDFRGDVLQPAALDVIGQMGLAERVLEVSVARYPATNTIPRSDQAAFPDIGRLKTPYPFMTFVPQVRFLGVIVDEARRCPTFRLVMGGRVEDLVHDEDGHVRGVRYRARDGWHEVRARLVVAADGRFSRVRSLAGLEPIRTPAEFDIVWFRLPRRETDPPPGIFASDGGWTVLHNRGTEWQVGCTIPKGSYPRVRAGGLEALLRDGALRVPWLADRCDALRDWNQVSLLAVESSRLRRWYRPGLLLIGDAAHTMSPIGAVGITVAIQDAVVASNVLGPRLCGGRVRVADLAAVQRRREWPVRIVQAYQQLMQGWMLATPGGNHLGRMLLGSRVQQRIPFLRHLGARIFGLGVWPVRLNRAPAPERERVIPLALAAVIVGALTYVCRLWGGRSARANPL